MIMDKVRRIVREEMVKFHEINEDGKRLIDRHPVFSNPEKAMDYAMEWIEKANTLKQFQLIVGQVLDSMDSPEEKIKYLKEIYADYIV